MSSLKLLQLSSIRDSRDRVYRGPDVVTVPPTIDLRNYHNMVEDQGNLGSCTGLAATTAYEILLRIKYPAQAVELSDLFGYYNTRLFYPSFNLDNGAYLRDTLRSIKRYGVCQESLWPYDISKFAEQPPADCYADAIPRTIINYQLLITEDDVIEILAAKMPVVVSIELYPGFDTVTSNNDVISMPAPGESITAYHAVVLIGYDYTKKQYLLQNSYGTNWGNQGYAWIPFDYIEQYSIERWCFDIADPTVDLLS